MGPWCGRCQGCRWRAPAGEAVDSVIRQVRWLGVDGVFLDSSREGSAALRAGLDIIDRALTVEGESRVPPARMGDQVMSWGQCFCDSDVPGVLRSKWLERRHEVHDVGRWHRSHEVEFQSAWPNGTSVLI